MSLTLILIVLTVLLGLALPRVLGYPELLDENLALRGHVTELDERIAEVDQLLLKLRRQDAQLGNLEPDGPHGPEPESTSGSVLPPPEAIAIEEVRPAEAWAVSVLQRAEAVLSLFAERQPDDDLLSRELDALNAFEQARPSFWPTRGVLTSGFGYRRSHRGGVKMHHGLDIANGYGTPIYASAAGIVVNSEWMGGYGQMVQLDHGFGVTTIYAHCQRLLVRRGQRVERGQLLATMGMTGQATGTHLHFEVRVEGHAVDPLDYLER